MFRKNRSFSFLLKPPKPFLFLFFFFFLRDFTAFVFLISLYVFTELLSMLRRHIAACANENTLFPAPSPPGTTSCVVVFSKIAVVVLTSDFTDNHAESACNDAKVKFTLLFVLLLLLFDFIVTGCFVSSSPPPPPPSSSSSFICVACVLLTRQKKLIGKSSCITNTIIATKKNKRRKEEK